MQIPMKTIVDDKGRKWHVAPDSLDLWHIAVISDALRKLAGADANVWQPLDERSGLGFWSPAWHFGNDGRAYFVEEEPCKQY